MLSRLSVVFVLAAVLAACGSSGGAAARSTTTAAQSVTTTTAALSDAAVAWCNVSAHLAAIQQAATSLNVAPATTVDEKDFHNADGTRNVVGLQASFEQANGDPGLFPHYVEPTGEIASAELVVKSPFAWWDQAGWDRICSAAFDGR